MTGAGTGLLKPAPGTWGSVPAVILAFLLGLTGEAWAISIGMAVTAVLATWGCVALGPWAEARWQRHDPPEVVIDEVAGQALTLLLLPWAWLEPSITWLAISCGVGFVSFRIFDILKPPPIRGLQRFPFGWGIVLDDLAAAVPAAILCWIVLLPFISTS
ncbi:MAG: phosphatidylglycerophosphatase A [Phycisphaerales bacterium]|nr:phosphatidylglycerophosphatase A [Phycisphaerales bacterium]